MPELGSQPSARRRETALFRLVEDYSLMQQNCNASGTNGLSALSGRARSGKHTEGARMNKEIAEDGIPDF